MTDPLDPRPGDSARPPRDAGPTRDAPPPRSPRRTGSGEVQYKGAPLDPAKGPGLGCFWIQLAALVALVILTPLSVAWGWSEAASAALLVATLVLLLFAGQTVIFLLRLVAAERRADVRRAPLASRTPTVGQIEDESSPADESMLANESRPEEESSSGDEPPTGEPGSGVPE